MKQCSHFSDKPVFFDASICLQTFRQIEQVVAAQLTRMDSKLFYCVRQTPLVGKAIIERSSILPNLNFFFIFTRR